MSSCARRVALLVLSTAAAVAPLHAGAWRPIGPWGGFVTQIVRCEAKPSVFYGLGSQGRVHRSADGGHTWRSANGDLPPGAGRYGVLLPDPSHPDLLWLSSEGESENWHTRDGGIHWSALAAPPPGTRLLAVAAGSGDVLFAGGSAGLFRSLDHGASWHLLRRGLEPGYGVVSLTIDRADPRLAWAAVRGSAPGVYFSHDGGTTWRRVLARRLYALRADPHESGTVLALDDSTLLRSRDAGATWQTLASDPGINQFFAFGAGKPSNVLFYASRDVLEVVVEIDGRTGAAVEVGGLLPHAFGATAIALDPAGDIVVSGFGGIVRSADRSATWTRSDNGFAGAVTGPVVALSRTTLIAGNERTLDGGRHWSRFLPDQFVTDLAVDPTDHRVVYAGTGLSTVDGTLDAVFKSLDGGLSWFPSAEGLDFTRPTSIAIDPREPRTLYLATEYDGLFQSQDAGADWHRIAADEIAGGGGLVVTAVGPRCVFMATLGGLRRSCDAGATWSPSLVSLGPWSDFAVARSDPNRIYAVEAYTSDGTALHFLRSTDGGASFAALALPLPSTTTLLAGFLAVDEQHPDRVFLAATTDFGEGGVWVIDGTGPWREISEGLFNRDLRGLRYQGGPRPRLLLSTAAGVFLKQLDD